MIDGRSKKALRKALHNSQSCALSGPIESSVEGSVRISNLGG